MLVLIQKQEQPHVLIAQLEVIHQIQELHHVFNVLQENIQKKNHQYVVIVLKNLFTESLRGDMITP